ncbi:MAG: hypothetical protein LBD68_05810 [Zoogloeaceae bacterium]|nr:hypothetical protein [Zoogloeaceae bacterium]
MPVGAETATTIGAMTAVAAAVGGSAGVASVASVMPVMLPGLIISEVMSAKMKAESDARVKAIMAEFAARDQANEQARYEYYVRLFKDLATVNHALKTDPAFASIRDKFCVFPFDASCPDVYDDPVLRDRANRARFKDVPTPAQRAALKKIAMLLDAVFDRAKADESMPHPFSQEKASLMFRLQQWRESLKRLCEDKYFPWIAYLGAVHANAMNAPEMEKIAWVYVHLPPETKEEASAANEQ